MIKSTINNTIIELQDSERQECEVWDRVMGYYRPISEFNIGKRQEHDDRHRHKEEVIAGCS